MGLSLHHLESILILWTFSMNRTSSNLRQTILMTLMLVFHKLVILVQLVLLIILIMLLHNHLGLIMIMLILLMILCMIVHIRFVWFVTLMPILIIFPIVILTSINIVRFNFKIFLFRWLFTISRCLFSKKTIFTAGLAVGTYKIRSCIEWVYTYWMPLIKILILVFMSLRI